VKAILFRGVEHSLALPRRIGECVTVNPTTGAGDSHLHEGVEKTRETPRERHEVLSETKERTVAGYDQSRPAGRGFAATSALEMVDGQDFGLALHGFVMCNPSARMIAP
jgi:hypothetical protein